MGGDPGRRATVPPGSRACSIRCPSAWLSIDRVPSPPGDARGNGAAGPSSVWADVARFTVLYLYVTPEDGRVRLEVAIIESPCAVLGGTLDTCLRPHGSHHLLVYANLCAASTRPRTAPSCKTKQQSPALKMQKQEPFALYQVSNK